MLYYLFFIILRIDNVSYHLTPSADIADRGKKRSCRYPAAKRLLEWSMIIVIIFAIFVTSRTV